MGKRKTYFEESLTRNVKTYQQYLNLLIELSISSFEWKNLPETIDSRYIEMELFTSGALVYFNDEVIGNLCLNCITNGQLNVYGYPISRRAYSRYNQYQKILDDKNSVIIWNNYMHTNSQTNIDGFARRLSNIDRIIDVNVNAQKTPILVQGNDKQRLSLINLYKEYDGNTPVIFGDKTLDLNALKCLSTQAPYVADKLYELKTKIWNEALTYLGITNVTYQKKERMVTDEVMRSQGGTIANRMSRLNSRREAVEHINAMFGTDIEVNFIDTNEQLNKDGDYSE
nr:MAG TPA_asm: upper collar protein [Caudoviricetes sp.]